MSSRRVFQGSVGFFEKEDELVLVESEDLALVESNAGVRERDETVAGGV